MHVFDPGTRVWIAQAANEDLATEAFTGDATVVAKLPCMSCHADLRRTVPAGTRVPSADLRAAGTRCWTPIGFLAIADDDTLVPVIAANPGVIAVPIADEEPVR